MGREQRMAEPVAGKGDNDRHLVPQYKVVHTKFQETCLPCVQRFEKHPILPSCNLSNGQSDLERAFTSVVQACR